MYLVNNSLCGLLNERRVIWERLSSFKNCIQSNKANYIIIKYVMNVNKCQMGFRTFSFRSVQIDWNKHPCGILSVPSKAQQKDSHRVFISWRIPPWCLFSLVLSLALFIPICSTLLHFRTWCAGLAACQSVTKQASEVLLMETRRCSWARSVSPLRAAAFHSVGSGLVSWGFFSPPLRGGWCYLYQIQLPAGWM